MNSIIWEMTRKCNLKCIYCSSAAGKADPDELNTGESVELLDNLADMGVTTVKFSGGEPLIRSDFKAISEYAKSIGLDTMLFTNGTLLSESMLKDITVDYIQIGIDTADPVLYMHMRGKDCMPQVISAIQNSVWHGLSTGIAITVSRLNFADYCSAAEYFTSYGIEGICFSRFVPVGRGEINSGQLALTPAQRQELVKSLKSLVSNQSNISLFLDDPLISLTEPLEIYGCACTAGEDRLTIAPNGDVFPCPMLRVKIGNIREQPLDNIVSTSPFVKALKERRLKGRCGQCEYRFGCGGCRANALYATGDPLESDPDCWIR